MSPTKDLELQQHVTETVMRKKGFRQEGLDPGHLVERVGHVEEVSCRSVPLRLVQATLKDVTS